MALDKNMLGLILVLLEGDVENKVAACSIFTLAYLFSCLFSLLSVCNLLAVISHHGLWSV